MKKTWAYLFAVMFLFAGCRPKGILRSGEMRDILIDLHKTDGMIQVAGLSSSETGVRDAYYAEVLDKHGVTQAEFDSSLVWYTAHPQFFNKIYPKVMQALEAEEKEFMALHEAELGTQKVEETVTIPKQNTFGREELDSVIWVMINGYPNSWKPLVHDFVDEFFPQIGVTSGGIVDTLGTRVDIPEVSHD